METGLEAMLLLTLRMIPHTHPVTGVKHHCTAFAAIVAEEPKIVEAGTIPSWKTVKELTEDSLYPNWYKELFDA